MIPILSLYSEIDTYNTKRMKDRSGITDGNGWYNNCLNRFLLLKQSIYFWKKNVNSNGRDNCELEMRDMAEA